MNPSLEFSSAVLPAHAPSARKASNSRIKELDGLRGIAVLAVIFQHYMAWLPAIGSHYGWLGVDLFFILSGFLIASILLESRNDKHYFEVFYLRRALRIFPPYYLGIFVYIGIALALGKPGTLGLWLQYIFYYSSLFLGQPYELTAVPPVLPEAVVLGLAVLWSLSVEEIYYTVWAPVIRYTTHKGFTCILGGMILVAPFLRWFLHRDEYPEIYTFYCRMDGLAYGSVVALLISERCFGLDQAAGRHKCINFLSVVILPVTVLFWLLSHGDRSNRLVTSVGLVLADVSFAFIVYGLVARSGGSQFYLRMFRTRWLCSIGTISYSLYLFHYPLLSLAEKLVGTLHVGRRPTVVLEVLVGLILSFAVAYGLWYGMESRLLRWKNRRVPPISKASERRCREDGVVSLSESPGSKLVG